MSGFSKALKTSSELAEEKTASLYDVTALFFMNSVVNQFDSEQISDPAAVIRKLIDLGDAGE